MSGEMAPLWPHQALASRLDDPWEPSRAEKTAWSLPPESPLKTLAEILNRYLRWQAATEQLRPIERDGVVTGEARRTLGVDAYLESEKDDCAALLSWCAAHGVLALPLHEAETIRLAPRWHSWSAALPRRPPVRPTLVRLGVGLRASIRWPAPTATTPPSKAHWCPERLARRHSGLWHTPECAHGPRQAAA